MRYFLYDVSSDYTTQKVAGISDFSTLAKAKLAAIRGNVTRNIKWSIFDIPPRTHKQWAGRIDGELAFIISTHGLLKNPSKRATRKKNPVKKFKRGDILPNGAEVVDIANGFVLAYWNTKDQYVTWAIDENGGTYWGHYFKTITGGARDFEKRAGRKANPMKRKTKKKRTAKQLANDKRLGRMAKARAAKRGTRKTTATARKKVATRRRINPIERYVIAGIFNKQLRFYDGVGFTSEVWNSAQISLSAAKRVAKKINHKVVIAPVRTSARKIMDTLEGKT